MRFTTTAVLVAAISGFVGAYTQPKGDSPKGNPISAPGLNEQVAKGKPFTITWQPTTPKTGTVTLLLLHGPSTNAVPMYPIAEKIPNTGSYQWTPKSNLAPENTHYGIQLIVDATGQFQYTPQFGISGQASSSTHPSNKPAANAGASSYAVSSAPASSAPAATNTPPAVSQISDGQPQAPTYITTKMTVTTCRFPSATGAVGSLATGAGTPAPSAGAPAGSAAPSGSGASPSASSNPAKGAGSHVGVAAGSVVLGLAGLVWAL